MIEKTNIMIGPKMGASPNTGNPNLRSGIITWGRSAKLEGFILMNEDRWYLKGKSPCDVLHKFIEMFDGKGWLN